MSALLRLQYIDPMDVSPWSFSPPASRPASAASAPKVTTLAATDITATSATLNGKVDPGGLRTDFYFISCDPTTSATFFLQTPTKWTDGTSVKSVSQAMTGLKPNTTYRYAVTAMNSQGKTTGTCLAFTTRPASSQPSGSEKAPAVATIAATDVTSTSAVLNASVNPNGLATKASFRSCAGASAPEYFPPTSAKDLAAGTSPQSVGFRLGNLKPGLTYRYAVLASNDAGQATGDCVSFTTPGQVRKGKPIVTTLSAVNIGTSSVTLCGTVNPNGSATAYSFAPTTVFGEFADDFPVTADKQAGVGTSPLNVTAHLSGLLPSRTYHYRIQAKNSSGTAVGQVVSFTTAGATGPPSVETKPPVTVLGTSVKLVGFVNPNGAETTYEFVSCDPVTAPTFFVAVPAPAGKLAGVTLPQSVRATIERLKPETTYRYALKATNSRGTKTSECAAFTTRVAQAAEPAVTTSPAKNVTSTSATLEGYVNPNGVATTVWFEAFPLDSVPGEPLLLTPERSVGAGIERQKVTAVLSGLFPGRTYRFHVRAKNDLGSPSADGLTFTTIGHDGIIVQTQPALSVTSTSAVLCAKVNPNGISTSVGFACSGRISDCFEKLPPLNVGDLKVLQMVQRVVTGLKPSTTYSFYAEASGPDGKAVPGGVVSFTTRASGATGPPAAITLSPASISVDGAELRGIVCGHGLEMTFHFEACHALSVDPAFPPTPSVEILRSDANLLRVARISGLRPDTTYSYRVVATTAKGTAEGECVTFKTLKAPAGK